jgi:LmbE family N-acetylglucosaminyl deacetylase
MKTRRGILIGGWLLLLGFLAGWLWREGWGNRENAAAAPESVRVAAEPALPPQDGKLRIIAFGAHPDDCEIKVGGTGAKWAALGHHVKFVSVTNGDIGHFQMAGGPLAKRRLNEVQRADQLLGVHTQVLDIHDGELEPNLAHRKTITRLIREWNADIVLSHRPNDYHPDHRYTGVLVQDASFMVAVPFICPDVPALKKNPVFLYYSDRFERPNPFRADLIVAIDDVLEKKLAALDIMESQFFERGVDGSAELLAKDSKNREARIKQVRQGFMARDFATAQKYRATLAEFYGKEAAGKIGHAEAFEITEYGSKPTPADLKKLFPFYDK